MTKTYNINELLQFKKDLDKQIQECSVVDTDELIYVKEVFTDHSNDNSERIIEPRKRISIVDYSSKLEGLLKQRDSVVIAIQKHNSEKVCELLAKRDSARVRFEYYSGILNNMPINRDHKRGVTRQHENHILESMERIEEPMFDKSDIEKLRDESASEERKLNTEIQKLNLNANIKI